MFVTLDRYKFGPQEKDCFSHLRGFIIIHDRE